MSNKVRVEHQPVSTSQVVYLITRFYTFYTSQVILCISSINSIITYVHPISLNRTMASVGVLRCLAMSGELLTTLEAVDGFDAQVGTLLGDRTGSGWAKLVGCLLA